MKIYGSSFSPYARKILAFCGEAGIDYELQAVGLGSDDPEFLAASPLRKIPAMEDDGFTLADSSAICHYLEAKHDVGLIPHDPALLGRTVWWDEVADTEIFANLQPLFFNRIVAPLFLRQEADEAAAARAEEEAVPAMLAWLETQMPEDGDWLVGERLTLADLAVASPLVNYAHCGGSLDAYPRVQAFAARMHARKGFASNIAWEKGALEKIRGG
ncbi:glutathione S-transferase family protein [Novosphingopyxis iocasae]|uniref:glutathione S-transferase family protein n=1 Tax=Novosphingopyxis iocasae TaxID=2762729 RepID=UPI0016516FFD|nr:glutathione S-transferase family protein [Novosphingopyxis iocasae]